MKPSFVISSPFDTYSGYGARSRDVIKAIVETKKYDVKLLSQRWGNTPFGFCKDNPEWGFLLELVTPMPLTVQPEIWAQITVPNEFQPVGKYNIGITAGIETTLVPGEWIEGCNKMDLLLVSSEHSKQSFIKAEFEKRNSNQELLGKIKLDTPVEVLFEGANLDVYKELKTPMTNNELFKSIDSIQESFAYLFVGHWMEGNLGEDRKNVGLLVKAFLETYKGKKKRPALILKTSHVGASHMDRDSILSKIKAIKETVKSNDLPNIYLIHGDFTDVEMNEIYNHKKIKAMVSLTKGEGFGRPLLEFTLTKKPLITTAWSGHVDFLNPEFTTLIGGQLENVHQSTANHMLLKESQWFSPNHQDISKSLKLVFENYKKYQELGKRQGHHSKKNFSWEHMKTKLTTLLSSNVPDFPTQVELILPELNLPSL